MRVLVIEDDRQISRQLVQALTTHGYVADTARDGEDGSFLGQTESYDAIILDLGLPVLDGHLGAARLAAGRDEDCRCWC